MLIFRVGVVFHEDKGRALPVGLVTEISSIQRFKVFRQSLSGFIFLEKGGRLKKFFRKKCYFSNFELRSIADLEWLVCSSMSGFTKEWNAACDRRLVILLLPEILILGFKLAGRIGIAKVVTVSSFVHERKLRNDSG